MSEYITGDVFTDGNNYNVLVGFPGAGSITITGDDQAETRDISNLTVGVQNGSTGYVALDGNTYGVTINLGDNGNGDGSNGNYYGRLDVGVNGGAGTMIISGGAEVISTNSGVYDPGLGFIAGGYNSVNVGRRDGGDGTLTVTGAGSSLLTYGEAPRITVGRQESTGTLNISDGATVGTLSLVVGRQYNANGTVNVDGATLNLNSGYGQYGLYNGNDYSASGPRLQLGRQGGTAELNITNGGVLNMSNVDGETDGALIQIARGVGSTATMLVSGFESEVNITQNGSQFEGNNAGIAVGRGGVGTLTVENTATINITGESAFLHVGESDGSATDFTGATSTVIIQSGGVINVTGGSENGNAGFVGIGQRSDSPGRLVVDGAGSQLNVSNIYGDPNAEAAFLAVGNRGTGEMEITNGGQVTIDGENQQFPGMNIGRGEDDGSVEASGFVRIDGAGSLLTVRGDNVSNDVTSGFIAVGSRPNAEGELQITNGGGLRMEGANAGMVVGNREGAEGEVFVFGTDSFLEVGGQISVGSSGDGDLTVGNGASLTTGSLFIGENGFADLSGDITGDLDVDGLLEIGDDAFVDLNLTGDFNLNRASVLLIEIEDFTGDTGDTLTIDGSGIFDTRRSTIRVELDENIVLAEGDSFVFATATGTITADTRTVFDVTHGIELTLSAVGNTLVFTAEEAFGDVGDDQTGDENPNQLDGNENANILIGLGGNDTLNGFGADDQLFGGDGDDLLEGGAGADSLDGGANDAGGDTASFGGSDEAVLINLNSGSASGGHAQDDTLTGIENLIGSGFDDVLIGNANGNVIDAGAGADTVLANDGDDDVEGGTGTDRLFGLDGNDTLRGGADNDIVFGGDDNDSLEGNAGEDTLNGNNGNDTIRGGDDNDELIGGGGDDELFGDDGVDDLSGGGANDTVEGGAGADVIRGGSGLDVLRGDAGNDNLFGDVGSDTLEGGADDDILNGFQGLDQLFGGTGNDTLSGGDNGDTLNGGADDDVLRGQGANDVLNGDAGADNLNGGDNNDTLDGGTENDFLIGGDGNDTFIFDAGSGFDQISDFDDAGNDVVDLRSFGFTDFATDVQANLTVNSPHVDLDLGGDTLRFRNTDIATLNSDDFILA